MLSEGISCEAAIQSLLVVDPHPLVRHFIAGLLGDRCGVVHWADLPAHAMAIVATNRPAAVIVELILNGSGGYDFLQDMRLLHPEVPVIVFTAREELAAATRCLRLGARAFITKSSEPEELADTVKRVLAGEVVVGRSVGHRLMTSIVEASALQRVLSDPAAMLSLCEYQVFQLIGQGNSTAEIAAALCRSRKTVETYRSRIKKKLGLRSASALARFSFDHFNSVESTVDLSRAPT